jgi:hypothetical protein
MKTFKTFINEEHESPIMLRDDGHYDVHGITKEHIKWLSTVPEVLAAKGPVTLQIPQHLSPVPNSLIGPSTGHPAVEESQVHYANRGGGRPYDSRMIHGEATPSRMLTVIARPHKDTGKPFLITAFGGTLSPKEVDDPTHTPESKLEAQKFWADHALLTGSEKGNP